MASGNWTTQNKIQPGIYINFKSAPTETYAIGDRGVVAICEPLSWGPEEQVMTIDAGDDTTKSLGYPMTHQKMLFLKEIFLGSDSTTGAVRCLLYRPAATDATKATATIGTLTATARYNGVRGNDIVISVTADPDTEGSFFVKTLVDGTVQDSQVGKIAADLQANEWVTFSGTGNLSANSGVALTNGTDGIVQAAAYASFLTMIEPYVFNVLIYDGADETTKGAYSAFVQRMRSEGGRYCQAVMANYAAADHEAVISVENGIILNGGTELTPMQCCWWVGGATAGAKPYESLTYAVHAGASGVQPRLTSKEIDDAIVSGNIAFMEEFGAVKIVTDINTLTTYTESKGKWFRKNRVIRTLDSIANYAYRTFSERFIGKTDNTEDGRNLLRASLIGYINELQSNGAVQNFVADDVQIQVGLETDSVVIDVAIQPVDAIEKIYMTVTVS